MRATKWDKDDDKVAISVLLLIQRILQSERATHTHTRIIDSIRDPASAKIYVICRYISLFAGIIHLLIYSHILDRTTSTAAEMARHLASPLGSHIS